MLDFRTRRVLVTVKTILNGRARPGTYSATWDGTDDSGRKVGAGVYFCSLKSGGQTLKRKLILTE